YVAPNVQACKYLTLHSQVIVSLRAPKYHSAYSSLKITVQSNTGTTAVQQKKKTLSRENDVF
ncbi:hypothetical protein CDAR_413261, partial [Caerostris darwini]